MSFSLTANQLIRAMQWVTQFNDTDPAYRSALDRLMALLDSAIDHHEADAAIHHAINALLAAPDPDAAKLLAILVDELTTSIPVSDRAKTSPWAEGRSFAVPLIVEHPTTAAIPSVLDPLRDAIEHSFADFHLVPTGCQVVVAPYLIPADLLPTTWSAQRAWGRRLLAWAIQPPSVPWERPADAVPWAVLDAQSYTVVSLVGVVLRPADAADPVWEDALLPSPDVFSSWTSHMIAILQQAWSTTSVVCGWPTRLTAARASGRALWNHWGLARCLQAAASPPRSAIIQWDSVNQIWQITLSESACPVWHWLSAADTASIDAALIDLLLKHYGVSVRRWI